MFNEMFHAMENDRSSKHTYKNASTMTINEKKVSFLNRYFVFQKMRHVNAEKLFNIQSERKENDDRVDENPIIIKKNKRKIVIV